MSLILLLGSEEPICDQKNIINSSGEQSQSAVSVGAGIGKEQEVKLNLGTWVQSVSAFILSISSGDIISCHKMLLRISEVDSVQNNQKAFLSLSNPETTFPQS